MIAVGCDAAWMASEATTSSTPLPTVRIASRSHIRNSVATWSFRDRPARSLPPRSSPTRSINPRSSAPCTSSSDGNGPKLPSATSSPRLSRPASSPSRCSSVSRPARCSTRSKWVDLLSAASASEGPVANRPPHRDPSLVLTSTHLRERAQTRVQTRRVARKHARSRGGSRVGQVPPRGDLARQAVNVHEALRAGLIVGIALVVGGEVEVVQRFRASAPIYRNVAAVQHHPDLSGDVLLRVVDEGLERALQRRVPEPVVDQLAPLLVGGSLEPGQFALQRDVLELGVRGDQRHGSRRLVDLAALDADQPVLDHVEPANALRARAPVQFDDRLQNGHAAPIYGHRHALLEADDDLVG